MAGRVVFPTRHFTGADRMQWRGTEVGPFAIQQSSEPPSEIPWQNCHSHWPVTSSGAGDSSSGKDDAPDVTHPKEAVPYPTRRALSPKLSGPSPSSRPTSVGVTWTEAFWTVPHQLSAVLQSKVSSTLQLLTFQVRSLCFTICLCLARCLATSLASTHNVSIACPPAQL